MLENLGKNLEKNDFCYLSQESDVSLLQRKNDFFPMATGFPSNDSFLINCKISGGDYDQQAPIIRKVF